MKIEFSNLMTKSFFIFLLAQNFVMAQSVESPAPTPAIAEVKRQSGKILGEGKEKLKITLDSPKGGWSVDRMVLVSGRVNDLTLNPITVSINGAKYLLRTNGGAFSRKFPVFAGKNTVIVSGTNKAGYTQESRSFFAKVPSVGIQAILTSDTDGVYTDLHVYEPNIDEKDPYKQHDKPDHIYWADVHSASGGVFYLNEQGDSFDQPGYGPYLYTHRAPPLGIYRIDANYWPSGDKGHTLGNLDLLLFAGTPNEVRRVVKQPLAKPGETVVMAWIRIDKGQKASVYIPGVDRVPVDNKVWPKWVIDYKAKAPESNYDYSE